MNYIKRLEEEVAVLREQAAVAYVEIEDLFAYLESPKFREDTTVQTKDVFARLSSARSHLNAACLIGGVSRTDAYCEARGGRWYYQYHGTYTDGKPEVWIDAGEDVPADFLPCR